MREDEEHAHFHEGVIVHLHLHGPVTVNMNGPPVTSPPGLAEELAASEMEVQQMRTSLLAAQAAVVALIQGQTNLTLAYAAYVADEPKRQAAAVADAMAADGADEDTIAAAIQTATQNAQGNLDTALAAIHANTSDPTPPPVSTLPTTPDGSDTTAGGNTDSGSTTQGGGTGNDSLGGGAGDDTLNAGGGDTLTGGQGNDSINTDGGDQTGNLVLATPVVASDGTPTASDLASNTPSSVVSGDDGAVAVVTTDPSITSQVGSPASAIVTDHPTDGTTLITPVLSPDAPTAGSVTVDPSTGAPTPVAS